MKGLVFGLGVIASLVVCGLASADSSELSSLVEGAEKLRAPALDATALARVDRSKNVFRRTLANDPDLAHRRMAAEGMKRLGIRVASLDGLSALYRAYRSLVSEQGRESEHTRAVIKAAMSALTGLEDLDTIRLLAEVGELPIPASQR